MDQKQAAESTGEGLRHGGRRGGKKTKKSDPGRETCHSISSLDCVEVASCRRLVHQKHKCRCDVVKKDGSSCRLRRCHSGMLTPREPTPPFTINVNTEDVELTSG
ncbi:uncharacterized protein V6R79_005883 [Siganus canaliculatus]